MQFEKTPKSDVVERKIRVIWTATDVISEKANESVCLATMLPWQAWTNRRQVLDEEPPAYNSPSGGNFQTPAHKKTSSSHSSPVPAPDFSEDVKSTSPPTSAISSARSAITSALPSSDELKAQLAEANAQIQRLKDRLADQGLRQRKTGTEAGTAVPATMQQSHAQSQGGVSIQVVALLCLLSFLIAYFFF